MKKRNQGWVVGTLIGVAAAGLSALLYAPKSGKALRKDIRNKAEDIKEAAEDYIDITAERGNQWMENRSSKKAEAKKSSEQPDEAMGDSQEEKSVNVHDKETDVDV